MGNSLLGGLDMVLKNQNRKAKPNSWLRCKCFGFGFVQSLWKAFEMLTSLLKRKRNIFPFKTNVLLNLPCVHLVHFSASSFYLPRHLPPTLSSSNLFISSYLQDLAEKETTTKKTTIVLWLKVWMNKKKPSSWTASFHCHIAADHLTVKRNERAFELEGQ